MTSKAPEVSSILKFVDIQLLDTSGKIYKLNAEEMISFENFYKRHDVSVFGELVLVEKSDIGSTIDFKTCTVKVYYVDLFNDYFYREFKIINIQESYNNRNIKVYNLKIRDTFSYFLSNLYISKSFTGSRVAALKEIVSTYNLEPLLTGTKLKFETEDDGIIGGLVLNKNLSILDFFQKEFKRIGYAFYQDKKGLYIKNKDNLLPGAVAEISDTFSQIATNQLYKNKIYEFINIPAQKEELDKTPKQKSYYYDIKTKTMKSIDDNIDTLKSSISMNKNSFDMQETVGFKAKFQNRSDNSEQKHDIIEQHLRASTSKLVVNGYVKNDINKVIEIELLGNKISANTQTQGNVGSSGKYIILSIIDKIIGDKMLQLIEVGRSDSTI